MPLLQKQGVAVTALVGPGRTIVDWLRTAGVKDIVHSAELPGEHSNARGLAWLKRSREFLAQANGNRDQSGRRDNRTELRFRIN